MSVDNCFVLITQCYLIRNEKKRWLSCWQKFDMIIIMSIYDSTSTFIYECWCWVNIVDSCFVLCDMINFHVISLIMMNYNHAISPPKTLVNTNGDCDVDIDNNFWSIRLWFMHLPLTSIIIYCHILVLLWSMFQPFFLIFGFHWSYTEVSLTWH